MKKFLFFNFFLFFLFFVLSSCYLGARKKQSQKENQIILAFETGIISHNVRHWIKEEPHLIQTMERDGFSPLLTAAQYNKIEAMHLLISSGFDVDSRSGGYFYGGYTPLMYAVLFGHKDGVKFLLDSGADRNLKSENGKTPLLLAIQQNFQEIIALLKEHPPPPPPSPSASLPEEGITQPATPIQEINEPTDDPLAALVSDTSEFVTPLCDRAAKEIREKNRKMKQQENQKKQKKQKKQQQRQEEPTEAPFLSFSSFLLLFLSGILNYHLMKKVQEVAKILQEKEGKNGELKIEIEKIDKEKKEMSENSRLKECDFRLQTEELMRKNEQIKNYQELIAILEEKNNRLREIPVISNRIITKNKKIEKEDRNKEIGI